MICKLFKRNWCLYVILQSRLTTVNKRSFKRNCMLSWTLMSSACDFCSDHLLKERQKNRAQRQQYLKYLLSFRPQQSTNRKQSAAEMTDVLYDTVSWIQNVFLQLLGILCFINITVGNTFAEMDYLHSRDFCLLSTSVFLLLAQDGSYLPSVSTLSSSIKIRESLVLMVPLSSPGVVAGRAEGKTRTVESMSLGSHVYNTLIVWFMSLVCMIVIKLGTLRKLWLGK